MDNSGLIHSEFLDSIGPHLNQIRLAPFHLPSVGTKYKTTSLAHLFTYPMRMLADLLWGSLFKLTFLGFGLLVIAKVFDLGVELQREQKMTI